MKEKLAALSASAGGAGALAAAFASFCCVGPTVFAMMSATSVTFSALLSPYRPYLLIISLALLAVAGWRSRKSRLDCREGECLPRAGRVLRIVLWCSFGVWAVSAVSYAATEWPRLVGPKGGVQEYALIRAGENPLRAAFNRDAGKVRVLMLVAPT
ncbi:MAG: mercuric transporter MerT family protein [Blastocatellia bacterium]